MSNELMRQADGGAGDAPQPRPPADPGDGGDERGGPPVDGSRRVGPDGMQRADSAAVFGHAPTFGARAAQRLTPMARLRAAARDSAFARGWRHGMEVELMHRSMGFAALGFVTLVPLLIVVAAADPWEGSGFASWVVDGLGLTRGQGSVDALFAQPGRVLSATTAFSVVVLAIFGVSFASSVQTAMERIWDLRPAHWRVAWRRLVFLAVLIGYLLFTKDVGTLLAHTGSGFPTYLGTTIRLVASVLFFWWMQRLLLSGRVGWLALLPGAILIVGGLLGLRLFSTLVFSPLIVSNAVNYGAVGAVLIVQSWLIGVGFVIYGGCMAGRLVDEEMVRAADRRRASVPRSARPPEQPEPPEPESGPPIERPDVPGDGAHRTGAAGAEPGAEGAGRADRSSGE